MKTKYPFAVCFTGIETISTAKKRTMPNYSNIKWCCRGFISIKQKVIEVAASSVLPLFSSNSNRNKTGPIQQRTQNKEQQQNIPLYSNFATYCFRFLLICCCICLFVPQWASTPHIHIQCSFCCVLLLSSQFFCFFFAMAENMIIVANNTEWKSSEGYYRVC